MTDANTLLPHLRLRFSIEHPNLEECYAGGYAGGVAGVDEDENPFKDGGLEHEQWLEGWWAGFYGDKPLYASEKEDTLDGISLTHEAANDKCFVPMSKSFVGKLFRLTGTIAATAIVGYQLLDLVA